MKRTYQPSKKRRKKTHGFRVRMKNSPHLFKRKRQKKRKVITI